jgi:hypothetical protein
MTLDSHVRLMDGSTGKLLNDFRGHINTSYRCRACFGFNEASVVCGDENGAVWAWDLLDVSIQVPLRTSGSSLPDRPLIDVDVGDGIRRRFYSRTRPRGLMIK